MLCSIPDNSANIGDAAISDLVESFGEVFQLGSRENQSVVHGTSEAPRMGGCQVLLVCRQDFPFVGQETPSKMPAMKNYQIIPHWL